jgi:enoyl-CoA hydratase/carnithine racemase
MFCAGVDLPRLAAGGVPYVEEFLPALSDALMALFSFPRPVVAALNGHAIAGGAVLAAACDRRVMNAERGRIGVTELLVGVPFPIGALEILRCAYGTARVREAALLGRTHPAEEALALGLVDEAALGGRVLARASEVALELAAIPADSFTHVKRLLQAPYRQRIARDGPVDDEAVSRVWTSATTLAALEDFTRRVLGS